MGRLLYVNPLVDWSEADVWAYIAAHDLPYCPVYDVLASIGVSIHHQRVGPLEISDGVTLLRGWPALYLAIVRRYGPRWTQPGRRNRWGIDPVLWLDIQDALKERTQP